MFLVGVWSPSARASIAYVQSATAVLNPGSSVTATYTSAQSAGDLNVVIIGWGGKGSIPPPTAPSSVTDSKGNTYVLAVGPTGNSTGNGSQSIYYASNILAAGAGSNSVTISFGSTSFPHLSLQIAEYSGVATSSPLDGTSAGIGTNATVTSGSVTTTNANDLLIGGDYLDAATGAAGSGFTLRVASAYNNVLEDQIVTSTGSYAATAPVTGPDWWIMQIAAFKAASGGSGAPSAPTNLSASMVSSTQINLTWTASTAGSGGAVSGYSVERCAGVACTSFAQIGTPTGTSYSDTTASPSTIYSYRVRASDTSGDLSTYSNVGVASTGIVYVQSATSVLNPGSSVTATYASVQNAGDLNVVIIGWGGKGSIPPGTAPSSVTDSKGNSYVLAVGPTGNSTGNGSQSIYYATNIAAASAGSNSVTISFGSTSFPHLSLQIAEYSGIATSSPVDGTSAAIGTNATVTSGFVTTASANDLLIGGDYLDAATGAAGSGFTLRVASAYNNVLEDQIVTTTGNYAATAPVTGPDWWIMQEVAFKAASGGSPAPSAPTSLSASTVSPTQINLSWTASTAGSGGAVNGYRVERCTGASCTSFAQIGTPTSTSYSDTTASPSTSYSYRVRASDTTGDLSAYSNVASASTGGTSITFIQSATAALNPGSSVTATYASAQNAGDLNVVIVGWGGRGSIPPGTAPSSVTDSKGNVYVLAVGPTGNSTGNGSQSTYYATNIVAASAGSNSVTVSFGVTSFTHLDLEIAEYSGVATSSPLDGTSAAIGTNATVTSGSVTTTSANDLLVGGDYVDAGTGAAGSGFTLRVASPNNTILEDEIVTSTGSYAATAAVSGPDWWIIQMVAFKAAGGGSGAPSAPTGLAASAVSPTQINLTWTASTPGSGGAVTGYDIERCVGIGCTNFTQIGTSSTTAFSDTGLVASTSYTYEIVATDAAGSLSAGSPGTSLGTPVVITYTYDNLKRITQASGSSGGSVTYTYDANGNVTSITRVAGP
jgi:YD repeat-containing protein